MFLAFANQTDPQIQLVQNALEKRGQQLVLIDTSGYPDQMGLHVTFQKNQPPSLWIKTEGRLIAAEEIEAVWVRRLNPASSKASFYDATARMFASGESQMMVEALAHIWPESTPWISKPHLISRACNKPYNLMIAHQVGFQVPETVFSNEIQNTTSFLKAHPSVAMKTLSTLWIQPEGQPNPAETVPNDENPDNMNLTVFYVRKYDSEQLLTQIEGLPYCPVIFQEYIPKNLELRVNVIGQQVLTCAIYSQEQEDNREDYRVHWTNNLRLEPFTLPPEEEQRCIRLVQLMGLEMGCIDLILTPEGQYVYLEINPVGQWIWIEERTGMPIADAIAALLIEKASQK